jgi:hypothetical protein
MVTPRRAEAGQADRSPSAVGAARRGWLDIVRDASDLALLGILTTVGALGLVTVAAAVATASAALHHWQERGSWPTARETVHRFGRALLPGVPVTLLAAATGALLALNAAAFTSGAVPGGTALAVLTLLLAVGLVGYASLIVVAVGRTGSWRAAAKQAAGEARRRPVALAALAGVTGLAALLAGTVIPVAAPILLGYLLFALHAVARRLLPAG